MGFDEEIIKKRENRVRLTTLTKLCNEYYQWDIIICLAHVVNRMTSLNLEVTNSEIYYAFKKFYLRAEHGDFNSYLKWLYKLNAN